MAETNDAVLTLLSTLIVDHRAPLQEAIRALDLVPPTGRFATIRRVQEELRGDLSLTDHMERTIRALLRPGPTVALRAALTNFMALVAAQRAQITEVRAHSSRRRGEFEG